MRDVEVRYAVRDGKRLAFEVFGSGPCDIAVVQSAFPIDLGEAMSTDQAVAYALDAIAHAQQHAKN